MAILHLAYFAFAAILFLTQILVCNFVRYLSNFRQTVLTEISDKKIVKMTRLVVLCSAILSSLLDNIEQEDHVHSPPFDGRSKSRNDGLTHLHHSLDVGTEHRGLVVDPSEVLGFFCRI